MNRTKTLNVEAAHEIDHSSNNMQHGGGDRTSAEVPLELQLKLEAILSVN